MRSAGSYRRHVLVCAGLGAVVGHCAAVWMAAQLIPPLRCEGVCEPTDVPIVVQPLAAVAVPVEPPRVAVGADAGSGEATPAKPAVDRCAELAGDGEVAAISWEHQEQDLDAAAAMLIGASDLFGLDYDVANAIDCDREDEPGVQGGCCSLPEGEPLRVGGLVYRTGIHVTGHEWDGMYSHNEVVVLAQAVDGELRPVHAIAQWKQHVPDCYTDILHQRQATSDLDGDGRTELCVESIYEVGEGLFAVMDAKRWRPQRRERSLRAYRVHPERGLLMRAEGLDARCPRRGYEPFVAHEEVGDSVAWRSRVQGGRLCPPRCAPPLEDACSNVHFER